MNKDSPTPNQAACSDFPSQAGQKSLYMASVLSAQLVEQYAVLSFLPTVQLCVQLC